MATTDYIPSRDADLDPFAVNFKALIVATPTAYGLAVSDGTAIAAAVDAWHTAFLLATNPTTRTHATITTKNTQRSNVKAVIRSYGATIRANHAVSDALKLGLGLHVASSTHTPTPPPSTYPLLTIDSFNLGVLQLHAADQDTPDRKAKPAGTAGLLLFSIIAAAPAATPDDAGFNAFLTRAKYQSAFDSADNGKMVTYFGRWTNGKGELGPWSPPVSIRIAA